MTKTTYSNYEFTDSRDADCTMDWQVDCDVTRRGKTYNVCVWSAGGRVHMTAKNAATWGRANFHKATKAEIVAAVRKWARV